MDQEDRKYTPHPEKAPYGSWVPALLPFGILAWFGIGYTLKWAFG